MSWFSTWSVIPCVSRCFILWYPEVFCSYTPLQSCILSQIAWEVKLVHCFHPNILQSHWNFGVVKFILYLIMMLWAWYTDFPLTVEFASANSKSHWMHKITQSPLKSYVKESSSSRRIIHDRRFFKPVFKWFIFMNFTLNRTLIVNFEFWLIDECGCSIIEKFRICLDSCEFLESEEHGTINRSLLTY